MSVAGDQIAFETIRSHKGWYYTSYMAPAPWMPLALLTLTVLEEAPAERVADAVEAELVEWVGRYPVPTIASACDITDDGIELDGLKGSNQCAGWISTDSGSVVRKWSDSSPPDMPQLTLDSSTLRRIFADVPLRPKIAREQIIVKRKRQVRATTLIAIIWVVGVPIGFIALEAYGPLWLGRLVALYGVGMAYVAGLKLFGRWPKSESDILSEGEESRRRQHHYHCERNPEGFARLKAENYRRERREAILREAAELRSAANPPVL